MHNKTILTIYIHIYICVRSTRETLRSISAKSTRTNSLSPRRNGGSVIGAETRWLYTQVCIRVWRREFEARVRVRAWLRFEWLVPKGTDPDPRGIAPTVRVSPVPFLLDRSHRRSSYELLVTS